MADEEKKHGIVYLPIDYDMKEEFGGGIEEKLMDVVDSFFDDQIWEFLQKPKFKYYVGLKINGVEYLISDDHDCEKIPKVCGKSHCDLYYKRVDRNTWLELHSQ